jgi:lipoate-protein ligase A
LQAGFPLRVESYRRLPAERWLEEEMSALRRAERTGEETLLVWEAEEVCAVLPRGGREDAHLIAPAATPFVRRESGGGAVLVGPGCLNYAFALSLERRPALLEVEASYSLILEALAAVLNIPGARAICSDLALGDRKFAGHAQRRTRRAMLYHGTILYEFELRRLGAWLREPVRRPSYRGGRRHEDFVVNAPVSFEALVSGLHEIAGDFPARNRSLEGLLRGDAAM